MKDRHHKLHLPTKEEVAQYEDVEEHFPREPQRQPLWTPAFTTGVAIIALGAVVTVIRLVFGLGSVTNLSDGFPWGLWIAFDVVVGIALAAGGFVTAAMLYIFNHGQYSPLVRPAIVTALLGYAMAAFGVTLDVGRWWQIYNPLLPSNWQGNSALFEVSICVMSYLLVLLIEFSPTLTDRMLQGPENKWKRRAARIRPWLNKALIFFILAGIVISMLHQSSLGSIMLLMSHRLHDLWYTPMLPLLFLLSAVGVGMHVVIVESTLSARTFKRKVELPILAGLAKRSIMVLGLYVIVKFWDLVAYGDMHLLLDGWYGVLWILEVAMFGVVPVFLLSFKMFRRNPNTLFWTSVMVIVGLVLNRFNVYLFAVRANDGWSYFPSLYEIAVSAMMVAIVFVGYKVLANYLPVLHREDYTPSPGAASMH